MQDKPVALVTGANKGIGLQIAKNLSAHGFTPGENQGVSRNFWAVTYTWLLDLFTAPSMRDGEPRFMPSVAFTPSGPLVYRWRDARCL